MGLARAELLSSSLQELQEEPPRNANSQLVAFLPSASGEEESYSGQTESSHSHSRIVGCQQLWWLCPFSGLDLLTQLQSLFICCMWLEGCCWPWHTCHMSHFGSALGLFPALQQANSGNSLWLIAHITQKVAGSFVQTVPRKSPSTSALFFKPKRSMWIILKAVNTGDTFITCIPKAMLMPKLL